MFYLYFLLSNIVSIDIDEIMLKHALKHWFYEVPQMLGGRQTPKIKFQPIFHYSFISNKCMCSPLSLAFSLSQRPTTTITPIHGHPKLPPTQQKANQAPNLQRHLIGPVLTSTTFTHRNSGGLGITLHQNMRIL